MQGFIKDCTKYSIMITFEKKKGKYQKYTDTINGFPYYILVEIDEFGNIKQIMEKPDLKQIPPGHYSGAHIVVDNAIENHYDHISGAMVWKEYPVKEGGDLGHNIFIVELLGLRVELVEQSAQFNFLCTTELLCKAHFRDKIPFFFSNLCVSVQNFQLSL